MSIRRLDGWIRHLRRFAADEGHQYHPTVRDPMLVRQIEHLVAEFRPDIVHVHGWILYSVLPARLPRGAALVVSLHDFSLICNNKTLLYQEAICSGPSTTKCLKCAVDTYGAFKGIPLALGLAARDRSYPQVQRFIANSGYVADTTSAGSDVERGRISVVPSPLPDAVMDEGSPRPDFLPPGDFVLFVGAMGRHKGLDVLLEAHERLKCQVPLVILGLPRADSPDCNRSGVVVVQNVPHDLVMASWRAAAVGAAPSVCAEAFGLVAVEAMAAGTPVIVTRVGGLQEVVQDGVTGLVVPPSDPQALAAGLDRLLADPELRANMGKAGRRRAVGFTVSAILPQLDDVYERAAHEAHG